MQYAYYNKNSGEILQWLDTERWNYASIPAPVLELTNPADYEQYSYIINNSLTNTAPTQFYIDANGIKYLTEQDSSNQLLTCDYSDKLYKNNGVWTVMTTAQITAQTQLLQTDESFIRVSEDLIAVLIAKGIIALTDLPAASQNKYTNRINLRKQI